MRINRRELLTGAAVSALAAGLPENVEALTPAQRAAVLGTPLTPPPGTQFKTETINGVTYYVTETINGVTYYLTEAA